MLPDAGEPPADPGAEVATGAYRGRRRATVGRRTRLVTVAAVTMAVGVVLVGSSLVARSLSAPVAVPLVPPSGTPSLSPSPSPVSPPPPIEEPSPAAGLGTAPEPSQPPTPGPPDPPDPSPPPSQRPPDPSPEAPSPDPPPFSLAFEAESGDLSGDTDVVSEPRASGGVVVDLAGSGQWCRVRFTGVAVDRGGRYDLTIHYLSRSGDTAAWVSVNDQWPDAVGFPETGGNSIATRTVRVELDAGDNAIAIFSPSCDDAPRLDRITVTE